MDSIKANTSIVHFNETCFSALNQHLEENNFSTIFILVDENTHEHCLPIFLERLETNKTIEIIEIESGEINKTIDTCVGVWNTLSELNADRKSLMINIGGGVITDLGGFVACTFKRGDTLPQDQMRSGIAEMLKHGLITGEHYWTKFQDLSKLNLDDLDELIHESVIIKRDVVEADPFEDGLRKTLNFGHTLGHAIESYFLSNPNKTTLLHGEAIVVGMILASYISTELV